MRNIRNGLVSLLCASMIAGCLPPRLSEAEFNALNDVGDSPITDASESDYINAGYDSTRNSYLDTIAIDSNINYNDTNSSLDTLENIADADHLNDAIIDGYEVAVLVDVNNNKDVESDNISLVDAIAVLDSSDTLEDVPVVAEVELQELPVVNDLTLQDIFVVEVIPDTNVLDVLEVSSNVDALEVLLTKDVSLDVATSCYSNYFQSQNSINNIVTQDGTFVWNKGQYVQQTDNSAGMKVAYFDNFAWDKLNLQVKVRMPVEQAGVQKVGLLFRYTPLSATGYNSGVDKGYFISLEKTMNGKYSVALEDLDKGEIKSVELDASVAGLNTWHTLAIKAQGNTLNGYLNGKSVFQINDVKYSIGEIGLGTYNSTGDWDDLLSCLP